MTLHYEAVEAISIKIERLEDEYKTYSFNTQNLAKQYVESEVRKKQYLRDIESLKQSKEFLLNNSQS